MKTKTSLITATLLITASFFSPLASFSQDGTLDITFSADGITTTNIVPGCTDEEARGVVIQSDGKILVAAYTGLTGPTTGYDFAIIRYNSDGSLDNSFDGDGKVVTSLSSNADFCRAIAVQPDGKIVVVGSTYTGGSFDFAVVRYNNNGSLDGSFDSDGILSTPIGTGDDHGVSVALQSDGKIVVAGVSRPGSVNEIAVVRYNANGSLDNTFDGDGILTTTVGAIGSSANSVMIQVDGKIVVGGYSSNNAMPSEFALVRYNNNGTLDNTFGGDGIVTTSFGNNSNVQVGAVMIRPDGRIFAAGSCFPSPADNFALARYNSDGSPDNTFDGDGKLTTSLGDAFQFTSAALLQPDGKIVVGGEAKSNGVFEAVLARFNADGTLDNTFDTGGKVVTDFGGTTRDMIKSVALQTDGKIVAAGLTYTQFTGTEYVTVARYRGSSVVGINTIAEQDREIKIYPNPFSAHVTLETDRVLDNGTLTVYNVFGQKIKELKNLSGQKIILSRDNLSSGLYFIRLIDDNKIIAAKELIIRD